jgi:hypothetical protein
MPYLRLHKSWAQRRLHRLRRLRDYERILMRKFKHLKEQWKQMKITETDLGNGLLMI